MLDELRKSTIAVVGVETAATDPSLTSRYESMNLSSVDSVDTSGGKIGLVFALAGATGNFGLKNSAKQPLPTQAVGP
jgi:hypothetical protein